jgi:hypothetical protein
MPEHAPNTFGAFPTPATILAALEPINLPTEEEWELVLYMEFVGEVWGSGDLCPRRVRLSDPLYQFRTLVFSEGLRSYTASRIARTQARSVSSMDRAHHASDKISTSQKPW